MSLIGTCSLVDASSNNVQIKYELMNTTDKTLYICKYYTPLERRILNSGVFTVYNVTNQCDEPYCGEKAKRCPPRAQDYQKIEPNEIVDNIVSFDFAFNFVPNQEYSITAKTNLHVIDDLSNCLLNNSITSIPCTSNTLTFCAK